MRAARARRPAKSPPPAAPPPAAASQRAASAPQFASLVLAALDAVGVSYISIDHLRKAKRGAVDEVA